MLSTLGLQLSEGHRIISLAKDSISPLSENVNSKIKKSVEDIDVQPIEESSDGTAMQNYSRLHEDAGLETRKQKTPEQLSSP